MPLGGIDTRYDLPHEELDKIRRRREIRKRLKEENVRERYNPFKAMKADPLFDPAEDRYMDIRKRGRLPNVPFKPSRFYSMVALLFLPVALLSWNFDRSRRPYLEGCADGSIPYRERKNKAIG